MQTFLDMTLVVTDYDSVDSAWYKDIFTVPTKFEEAWNHPYPYQLSVSGEISKTTSLENCKASK
jgi:hypothetical protein